MQGDYLRCCLGWTGFPSLKVPRTWRNTSLAKCPVKISFGSSRSLAQVPSSASNEVVGILNTQCFRSHRWLFSKKKLHICQDWARGVNYNVRCIRPWNIEFLPSWNTLSFCFVESANPSLYIVLRIHFSEQTRQSAYPSRRFSWSHSC